MGKMIDLNSELTFRNAFLFPLQSRDSRRELLIGGLWLLLLPVGWFLNMGHRIEFVHNMQMGQAPWPAWTSFGKLFKSGFLTFLGMVYYYLPGAALVYFDFPIVGVVLLLIATCAIPGYMSHYCRKYELSEIFHPWRALSRVLQGGRLYWKAWAIALAALLISFVGFLGLGVGFLLTSVWFWQVAGYSFANVMTKTFRLSEN